MLLVLDKVFVLTSCVVAECNRNRKPTFIKATKVTNSTNNLIVF